MSTDRVAKIEGLLQKAFSPKELLVKDQSHLHAGHAGAQDGRGHFEIIIIAKTFDDCSRIQSHRVIYEALGDMMSTDIHALSIKARGEKSDLSG